MSSLMRCVTKHSNTQVPVCGFFFLFFWWCKLGRGSIYYAIGCRMLKCGGFVQPCVKNGLRTKSNPFHNTPHNTIISLTRQGSLTWLSRSSLTGWSAHIHIYMTLPPIFHHMFTPGGWCCRCASAEVQFMHLHILRGNDSRLKTTTIDLGMISVLVLGFGWAYDT